MNSMNVEETQAKQEIGEVKRTPILITLVIGAFFAILNETLLNVAITDLIRELDVTASTVQWLSTGFLLIVGILIPISALLIQWFTTRQMVLGALMLFAMGTLISGVAPSFGYLLLGRLIQASGTGLLIPVMMNTILVLFPPEKRGAAMGNIGFVIMFAPAIGPTLSGFILEVLHWRWLFFLVLPFAIFSIIFAAIFMKNVSEVTRPKVDILSLLLSTLGFGGLVFGFSMAGEGVEGTGGWSSPMAYVPVIIGGVSIALFVWRQLLLDEPMLDVRVFQFPMFSLTALLLVLVMMSMFSTMILLPMFLQGPLALSSFAAGFVLLPGGVLNGLMSPVTGRLYDKFGPRVLVIPGTMLLVFVMWTFTGISENTSIVTFMIFYTLFMVGISMIMMPGQTNGLNQLPSKYYPHGTAILNTLQQVAGAIGVAFFISMMSAGEAEYLEGVSNPEDPLQHMQAMIFGIHHAFTAGLVIAMVCFFLSLFIKRTVSSKAPYSK